MTPELSTTLTLIPVYRRTTPCKNLSRTTSRVKSALAPTL